ncbi:multicopper oxidase domain-containing protein, partial [Flavobacterium sp. XS1P32]|uniref:multicopper oxidase domain-containing protein n=1 Tax=Flavobacterium sp. XS1P32 TaxID=3401726 RepID=UPI003AAEBC27
MKNLLLIFVFAMFPTLLTAQNMKGMDHAKKETQSATYTCVMHPEIHVSKPGKCPKCGMDLVKEKAKPTRKTVVQKQAPKAVVKKTGTAQTNGVEVAKETENLHKNHNPVAVENKTPTVAPTTLRLKSVPPRTVRYDLYVRDTIVTFGDKPKRAIAVNGQIPMPTLTFTEGDVAEIYVHNELNEDTSLHWHGLFLPNKEDGVPNLTQMPIKPGTTHKYTFPIIQHGTHWYHSHTGLQEQIGMYGSFIMNKRNEDPTFRKGIDDLPTIPIILSEWTDMKPENVHRMLHNATDWFAIQKGTTQSYAEAIRAGHFKTKVTNEWK